MLEMDEIPAEKMAETLFAIHDAHVGALAKVQKAITFVHRQEAETMVAVKKVLVG